MRYHPHGRHIDTLAYYLNYLIMEKKSNGIAITKSFAKKMEGISPFELKNRLIDMSDERTAAIVRAYIQNLVKHSSY